MSYILFKNEIRETIVICLFWMQSDTSIFFKYNVFDILTYQATYKRTAHGEHT